MYETKFINKFKINFTKISHYKINKNKYLEMI